MVLKTIEKNNNLSVDGDLVDEDFAERFYHIARNQPSSVCLLVDRDSHTPLEYTFAAINEAVCEVLKGLQSVPVKPKQLIALQMERGANLVIALLACLCNRSPFLLLEPNTPLSRRQFILGDANPAILITDRSYCNEGDDLPMAVMVRSFQEVIDQGKIVNMSEMKESCSYDDVMYIMYTSGSTGQPKGVLVPYRAIYNRFRWMWRTYPWTADDVQLWKTSVVFGDCIWELFGGLLAGIPTVVASAKTIRDPCLMLYLIQRTKVSRITLTPTMLSSLLKLLPTMSPDCFATLRYVITSGEALPKVVCKQFLSSCRHARLLNLYGSTEIGNDATYYEVSQSIDDYDTIPIGKPITGIHYKIVNDELWIAGEGLCKGYLNRDEMTNSKFMQDIDDHRYFKTGDSVRECTRTGQLLFFGRIDSGQVKLRGMRVELEEVEAVCLQHPLIEECGCFVHKAKAQLVALVYTSSTDLSQNDLREWLARQLPDYELPSLIIFVKFCLPRTMSGKLDRKALADMYEQCRSTETFTNSIEQYTNKVNREKIFRIWCNVLEIPEDDEQSSLLTFTELGGHSLLAIRLQCALRYEFGIYVSIEEFFHQTRVDDLIKLIENSTPVNELPRSINNDSIQTVPLTLIQKSIWIADELQDSSIIPAYNVSYAFEINHPNITIDQIQEAIYTLVQRHDALRMVFSQNISGDMQQTVATINTDLTIADVKIFQQILIENSNKLNEKLVELARTKLSLTQAQSVCRFFLCVNSSQRILVIVAHHVIIDGWSVDILVQDLEAILTSQTLPPAAMQFSEYAILEHNLGANSYAADLNYWKEKLTNGVFNSARLLHDHEMAHDNELPVGHAQILFESDIYNMIHSFSKKHDVTPFMILLTTLKLLLARYTQETDIIIGVPVANRGRVEIERTIGLFINTLPLRTDLSGNVTFMDLLSRVRKTVLDAFAHQSLPFLNILSGLNDLQRNHNQNNLFQILFAYQNVGNESLNVFRKLTIHEQVAKFEIEFHICPRPTTIQVDVYFRSDFFQLISIEKLLKRWLKVTQSSLTNSLELSTRLSMNIDNDLLSVSSNMVTSGYDELPNETNLCELLLKQVKRVPKSIAVEDGLIQLTYMEIWKNSMRFSRKIHHLLDSLSHQCVAIRLQRGAHLIQTIWSVLISGNYYVYIDPDLPLDRQHFILKDTDTRLLITDDIKSTDDVLTIQFESLRESLSTETLIESVESINSPNDLAYILYTSGSTGSPKGVRATHRAIMTRMVNVNYHSIETGTRVGQMSTFSFDMSTFEMFGTMLNGGTLVIIVPEATCSARKLLELKLDVISPSTAVLNVLAQQDTSAQLFNSLRTIYFGGEKVNMKYLRRTVENQNLNKFVHVYGPTETTVFALFYEISKPIPREAITLPIGRPLTKTCIYIVDEIFQLVPRGIPGQLLIGGPGLSEGYHKRGELTNQKFISNPFGEGILYCTGDICRMYDDGNIEFQYRRDTQVKLRSQRLELGEIEYHLMQHKHIANTIVVLRDDIIEDDQHLVAYVQPATSLSSELTPEEIQSFLGKRLPRYMVPTYIVIVSQLPLNHVGKIDKRSLPKPLQSVVTSNILPDVCSICCQMLKQETVDMNKNFFQLGGHSLSAMKIIAKIYENFKIQVSMSTLFRMKSLVELSQYVESQFSNKTDLKISEMTNQASNTSSAQRAPLTPAQRQFWLFWKLNPNSSHYNVPVAFKINGQLNMTLLTRSLHTLMCKYKLLRVKFEDKDQGALWQEEMSNWSLPFIEESVEGTFDESHVIKRLQYHSMKSFELKSGHVCRFVVLHSSQNQHLLLICFHHIICDGQSVSVFVNELFDLYNSNDSTILLKLNEEDSYLDYATRISQMTVCTNAIDTMVSHLADFRSLKFDEDVVIKQAGDFNYQSYASSFVISVEESQKLRELASSNDCTLHILLMTLFKCVLSIYCSDTSDIVIASIMSMRSQPGINDMFGPLINTVPVRSKLPNETKTTFIDLLQSVRSSFFFSIEHQFIPFSDIVQRLRSVSTDPSLFTHLPVASVLFEMNSYNIFDRTRTCSDGSVWAGINDTSLLLPFVKLYIDLEVMDYGNSQPIRVTHNVNRNLFQAEMVHTMAECYRCAIQTVLRNPNCSRNELWQLLHLTKNYKSNLVVHSRIRNIAESLPDQQAVIYQEQIWTYAQLWNHAEQIAVCLYNNNTRPGEIVGIFMQRCPTLIATILGVLIVGGTYLYLDPELPEQRISKMLQHASVRIVLEDENRSASKEFAFKNVRIISAVISSMQNKIVQSFPIVKPSDYCYLIYTSGSTGEPKGIKIQHQAIVRRINMPSPISQSSRVAQLTSFSFDVYILEVYGALLNGATLVIYDKKLLFQPNIIARKIIEQQITHMYLPTPIFNLLAEYIPDVFANMECVLFAGDRANAKLMRKVLQTRIPPKRLVNAYGPTESTCIVTWYDSSLPNNFLSDDTQVPIGVPLPDTPLYVVNPATLELVNDGEEGELLIGGFGVSDGYLNNANESLFKFFKNRYGGEGNVYRTGDRVRRNQNGNIEFHGRQDTQTKINGYRIELSEIEHALQGYSTITEAIVIIRDDLVPNTKSIVAYVRPKEQNKADIRQHLANRLPPYMLPSFIVSTDELPISLTGGKRDIKRLPPVPQITSQQEKHLSFVESKIQDAWNRVLNGEHNNRVYLPEDNFFACGGTSINILQLHSQLESLLGLTLNVLDLFTYSTISSQVAWLTTFEIKLSIPKLNKQPSISTSGIAVIGMAARYGYIETPADLWTVLRNGIDMCTRLTHQQLLLQDPSMADMLAKNPNYVHAGCTMKNALCFDNTFFGMTKRDADITDPQHRITLEATYEALEDAGLVPHNYKGTIGIFGAVYRNTYGDYYNLFRANPYEVYDTVKSNMKIETFDAATIMRVEIGNMIDGAPTFVSYKLGLNGPSMAIQTACSSSGTALHMALRSLEVGDCSVAIVTGVCINFPLGMGYNYQAGMIMSKTGVCRSFDEAADGVVGGDGAGVVVLMKTEEAENTGYPIRAIITGHAINNDGQNKASYSTTSPEMQAKCMKKALEMAQIQHPQTEIDYVEAHGPGTQMGDLLEIQALTQAYSENIKSTEHKLYLGSIKTNAGHTAHAASLAGLIKIILSLEANEIPPNLNFHRFSQSVARLQPPFQINTQTIPWLSESTNCRPRRAALNALGQGGTNTHFIIEQASPKPTSSLSSSSSLEYQIFLLSAKTDVALSKIKKRLHDHLTKLDEHNLLNVAYTLACGRIFYEKRSYIVAASVRDLREQLCYAKTTQEHQMNTAQLIFVFPGQGSQYAGIARKLHDCFPHTYAPIINSCLYELKNCDPNVEQQIRSCLFDEHFNDQNALMKYAQITLFIVEYSLATFLISLNIRPSYLLGHSSGEFVAACIAGVMNMEDAIRILFKRCQLLMETPQGSMLAVEVRSIEDAHALSATYNIDLAVVNSPIQCVFSGSTTGIQTLEEAMRKEGRKVKALNTYTAFHSRLMDPISQKLEENFRNISLNEPKIPIISTVNGRMIQHGEMTQTKYWRDHLRHMVLFGPSLTHMLANNLIKNEKSTIFILVGPDKPLNALLSRAAPETTLIDNILSRNSSTSLFHALGNMWVQGIPINWSEYFRDLNCSRIPLPTYPFERTICVADNRAKFTENKLEYASKNNIETCTPVNNIKSASNRTDLFELIAQKNIVISRSNEPENINLTGVPWKIDKQSITTVKLFDLQNGSFSFLQGSSKNNDEMELNLGSCSCLFTLSLYYEAIELGLVRENDLVRDYLPREYTQTNIKYTLNDLLQGTIHTNIKCHEPSDLLRALEKATIQAVDVTAQCSSIFTYSLLGHILAAIHENSYDRIVYNRIISPLGLKKTTIDTSNSNKAYCPAVGIRTSVSDMQTLLNSSSNQGVTFRKALLHHKIYFTNDEQLIVANHPYDVTKCLLIANEQRLNKVIFESVLQQIHEKNYIHDNASTHSYKEMVQECLSQLVGPINQTVGETISPSTTFVQLGIDSLQAITLVELLSQKLNRELSIDIISEYPSINSLSDYLVTQKSINLSLNDTIHEYVLNKNAGLPYVYESTLEKYSFSMLLQFIKSEKLNIIKRLNEHGALLFRGFPIDTPEQFSRIVELLADKDKSFLNYRDGISPRTLVTDKVFTSTEYPKQFDMALHNEMSYSIDMPSMIFFFCQIPPDEGCGGETPIGDSRAIFEALNLSIRQEFIEKKLLYVTNLPSKVNGISLGKSWQDTYQTKSKREVEHFLTEKNIQFKWLSNDHLRTIRQCEAVRQHPISGKPLWCNHAHLFHPTDLNQNIRQALQKRFDPLDMPKNCFFGNGEPIPDTSLDHIRQVLKNNEIKWPWRKGDVLLLDNLRIAHGRSSFKGQRQILVAMC